MVRDFAQEDAAALRLAELKEREERMRDPIIRDRWRELSTHVTHDMTIQIGNYKFKGIYRGNIRDG
jgi:hypothetical protein